MCSYQKSQLFPSQFRFSLDSQITFPWYHYSNKIQDFTKTPPKIPICLPFPLLLIQTLNYTCAKDWKMLLRSIIKWEPSSSNPVCILASVGKHFMGPFSQKKDLSGCKFPAPRKVWLVRSRMSFGRDYSTGGEHEGESLIAFCDRFQQRLELLSPTSHSGALLSWLS